MAIVHRFTGNKHNELISRELTPIRAIRWKCKECSNFQPSEVRECHIKDCALWPFRMGNAGRKSTLTPEQRQAAAERMREIQSLPKKSVVETA